MEMNNALKRNFISAKLTQNPQLRNFAKNLNNMYPAQIVIPMKEELTENGFEELLTPEDVDAMVSECNVRKEHFPLSRSPSIRMNLSAILNL